MCWPLFQGQHAALHALVPLHRLLLSAGSTHLQPGPLRFMVPVSPEELSSADVDMEEEDVEEDMEEDVEEDMDPGEAIAQQIIQQAPAAPMALEGQSIGWGAWTATCPHCCLTALKAYISIVPRLSSLALA